MAMSSIKRKPSQRVWSKGREASYLVSSNNEEDLLPSDTPRRIRKPSHQSDIRASMRSANNSYSLEDAGGAKTDQESVPSSSCNASLLEEDGSSESSMAEEENLWESLSVDGGTVRLLSNQRKTSLALDEILLDIDLEKTPDKNQTDEDDEYADVDVKAIAAAILGRRESDVSESDSDSDTSTAVSEGSDVDDATSDEESDEESVHEDFDIDHHINKLVKGGSESESESDSEFDGNESAASEKLFQKAVQKVMKKFKRERSQEIVESDLESTLTTEKGSETEESPTSEDSDSETSDQGQDPSDDESSRETDLEIVKPEESGLVTDPNKMKENKRISPVPEEAKTEGPPKKGEAKYSAMATAEDPLIENEKALKVILSPTLEESNAQDLRWPFSNFYVKEFKQDLGVPLSDNEEALPSYKSTVASAAHPGRKKNVMLGRVWWVEWWAKEENKFNTV